MSGVQMLILSISVIQVVNLLISNVALTIFIKVYGVKQLNHARSQESQKINLAAQNSTLATSGVLIKIFALLLLKLTQQLAVLLQMVYGAILLKIVRFQDILKLKLVARKIILQTYGASKTRLV